MRNVQQWPVDTVAVAVVDGAGAVVGCHGPQDRPFRLASVTKLLSAYAVLLAVEEGTLNWDQPTGPQGAAVRHLIAHASGLAFDSEEIWAAPAPSGSTPTPASRCWPTQWRPRRVSGSRTTWPRGPSGRWG